MAGRYSKQEIREKLHRSAFALVTAEGIERVTGRKVAAGGGLSEPYIYQCYADMPELLTDAFMRIDRKVARLMQSVIQKEAPDFSRQKGLEPICWNIWSAYWRFLMEDPEQTVFYWRFYQSAYYTKELLEQRRENFGTLLTFIQITAQELALEDKIDLDAVVSNMMDDTVSAAVKIHLGYLSKDAIPAPVFYGSVFALLYGMMGIEGKAALLRRQESELEEKDAQCCVPSATEKKERVQDLT